RNRVLSHPAHQHRAVKEAELNPGRFKFPATPAHILKTTITDQQIIDQFDKASHRAQAQAEIDRWGTAVNWTDFYHSGTWHETY
ncbi:hypothetical protein QP858_06725, partial [Trueperella bernardiae]|nr:hypothetical protein [Trueperella bernardiae]